MTSKRDITTISISSQTATDIEQMATKFSTSKKEMISLIVEYINTQQIDPRKNEAPATEFEKINKRFNQVFAFMKKQEQTYFNQMIFDIVETKKEVLQHSQNFAEFRNTIADKLEEIRIDVIDTYNLFMDEENEQSITDGINENIQNKIPQKLTQISNGLEKLLEHTDPKNKSGLMGIFK